MKPLIKKEKSSSSEELSSQRPKRSTSQKNTDVNNGLLWREETDLKKALYASLQETRKKNFEDDDDDDEPEEIKSDTPEAVNGHDGSPKKAKVHAQRKFAQGSTPTSPTPTPQKVPNHGSSTTELIPYRRPKTEDFLTFLCLRGTSILPPSLDFLNCCSKSDTSSECRSLSPELEVKDYSSNSVKVSTSRDKINAKVENHSNGVSRKHTACKASSKRHPEIPLPVKKSNNKSQKETSLVRKKKLRDGCDVEVLRSKTNVHIPTSGRTRSSTLHALKEKYKKQRLAAGKKKLLPAKNANFPVSGDKPISNSKPQNVQKETKRNSNNISTRNKNKSSEILVNKMKSTVKDKKLAIEKRKSLRSAHFSKGIGRKKITGLNKKTMWLRRAKLVPPIVDVDSDSEPEILSTSSDKRSPNQKTSVKQENSSNSSRLSKRLRNQPNCSKTEVSLTSRQILLRKHMQNRLKAKKSILHTKNLNSKIVKKRTPAKQIILKKEKRNIGLKTMSLRKDLQNKRVTRSAKQQIEEMLWANPDKRAKGQLPKTHLPHKLDKKRHLPEPLNISKKQKLEFSNKDKENKLADNSERLSKGKLLKKDNLNRTSKQTTLKMKATISDSVKNTRSSRNIPSIVEGPSVSGLSSNGITQAKSNLVFLKTKAKKEKSKTLKPKISTSKLKTELGHLKIENKSKCGNLNLINEGSNRKSENKNLIPVDSDNSKSRNENSKVINKDSISVLSSAKINHNSLIEDNRASNSCQDKENTYFGKEISKTKNNPQQSNVPSSKENAVNFISARTICTESNHSDSRNLSTPNEMLGGINQGSDMQLNNENKSDTEMEIVTKICNERNISFNTISNNAIHHSCNNFDLSVEFKELNVQNNLNVHKIEKTSDKDISKLMTLNVECEESVPTQICEPSTSGLNKIEIKCEKNPFDNKPVLPLRTSQFKKHNDKKYFKKSSRSEDTKLNRKSLDQSQKLLNKNGAKLIKNTKEKKCDKNVFISKKESVKLNEKRPLKKDINTFAQDSLDTNMSDSDSPSDSSDSIIYSKVPEKISNKTKFLKKQLNCNTISKSNKDKQNSHNLGGNREYPSTKPDAHSFSLNKLCETNLEIDVKCEKSNKNEKKISNVVSNKIEIESDDDSDNDLTINQYLKLMSKHESSTLKHKSSGSALVKKEINQTVSNPHNDNALNNKNDVKKDLLKLAKEDNLIKKEYEKEQKSKKEGLSKHKKDKDHFKGKSHEKSLKKDEKVNKKDVKNSLAKLLKKEKDRSKSSKKEEKLKHKREGSSSSKSSKRDFDKDGSKLRRESEKDLSTLEKQSEKKVEFLETKKDKISKKELSKISRSNSYDETKSPKKKKKYNELKDIEKIKNLISNSSILNEISGFKAFKRRLSSDKSDLKKRLSKKKQKKLALLKQKKLSKKLSSKLLRKYSKKKGLKSKKNKLKKKEHKKDLKTSDTSKIHSRNKKQKHKMKEHRRDSQEKVKSLDNSVSATNKNVTSWLSDASPTKPSNGQNQVTQMNIISSSNVQTSTSDINSSATYVIENIADVIPSVKPNTLSADISQSIPSDLILNSSEELTGIVTTELSGVFEEGFTSGTILLTTRDNVSQVPVHFIQDIPVPKTMADAATNTCEEDIDEVISAIPEHLKSDEMSVGTQTMTPAGSPSPTVEVRSLISSVQADSTLVEKSNTIKSTCTSSLSSCSSETPMDTTPLNVSEKVSVSNISEEPLPFITSSDAKTSEAEVVHCNTISLENSKQNTFLRALEVPSSTTSSNTSKEEDSLLSTSASISSKKISSVNKTSLPLPNKIKKRVPSVKKSKTPIKMTSTNTESFPLDSPKMVAAPVYRPSSEEFQDPLEYISKIYPEAEQYGICKIIPPASFKPECKVSDDLRFMALNQYLHKMLYRWGPNVQHTACIKKHLKSQKVKLEQAPLIGGIELDISKFYHTVQQFGGLQQVIEKKKWHKVADVMRVPKAAQDRVTKLYDAYCKYLVSYDTLPSEEKQKLDEEVIADHDKYVRLRNSSKDADKDDELEEDENPECVTKGRSMPLSNFFRIARNTMSMWFKNDHPLPEEVEHEFWKIVTERNQHVVVHAGNIDSNTSQSGFPSNRSPFAKHPWNLKVLTNNNRSILRCMGPVSGITSPTLHVGMLFTTSCWYRDPHSLPWIEYLHTGASKIWYGIPANGSEKFKVAMKKIVPEYCIEKSLWLSSESSMIPPDLLVKHGSSLSRTIQKSGQFVVIFPESFTSTICCGYCVSESVYFAPTLWLDLAVKAFQDIQDSCESPAFSLERLLFSIANDPKPQLKTLQRILPMIESIRSKEMNLRSQLFEIGLKQFERLPASEPRDKKKKLKNIIDENGPECEICSSPCYLSRVVYPQEDTIYCLPHALEHIQKKNLKLCKIMYSYDKKDFDDVIERVTELVSQLPKYSAKKTPQKKKTLVSEK